jgi:hypothetical protein
MALSLKKKDNEAGGKPKQPRAPKPSKAPSSGDGKKAKSGKGARRFVLIIGDEGGILIFMHGSRVMRRLFAPSAQPSHSEAMVEIISANPSVPIYILADVIDQQYIPQTFPPVSSLSVGGLVKRRLERDFQPEDLKGSLPLGRDKTGRKEWKYLLVSLAKTPLLTEWLDRLVELPNELKGIYLVPIESVHYVSTIAKKLSGEKPRPWQLFISHNKVSGFRQVVIHDGRLVFTRVSQAIDDAIPAVIAGNIEQEIINTIEYLKRLEFRDSAELEATIVISQDVLDSMDLNRFGFARTSVLTPINVAETLGLEQAALSADRFGDVVLAAAFGIAKKRMLRFSNAYIDRLAKLYKARTGIKAVAALIAIGLLGMAGMSVMAMMSDYGAISEAKRKHAGIQEELDKERKKVDDLKQDVAFKAAVVAAYDAYFKDVSQPQDFVAAMAPLLSQTQRVTSMLWENEASRAVATPNAAAPAGGGSALPIKVTIDVDFAGGGSTLDLVEKTSSQFVEALKTKLVQYELNIDTFPWQKEQTQTSEVQELTEASDTKVQNAVGTITLRGVKKDVASPATPPAMGAAPSAMSGMGAP